MGSSRCKVRAETFAPDDLHLHLQPGKEMNLERQLVGAGIVGAAHHRDSRAKIAAVDQPFRACSVP